MTQAARTHYCVLVDLPQEAFPHPPWAPSEVAEEGAAKMPKDDLLARIAPPVRVGLTSIVPLLAHEVLA